MQFRYIIAEKTRTARYMNSSASLINMKKYKSGDEHSSLPARALADAGQEGVEPSSPETP